MCASPADCASGYTCQSGSCVNLKPLGASCASGDRMSQHVLHRRRLLLERPVRQLPLLRGVGQGGNLPASRRGRRRSGPRLHRPVGRELRHERPLRRRRPLRQLSGRHPLRRRRRAAGRPLNAAATCDTRGPLHARLDDQLLPYACGAPPATRGCTAVDRLRHRLSLYAEPGRRPRRPASRRCDRCTRR